MTFGYQSTNKFEGRIAEIVIFDGFGDYPSP